MEKKEQKATHLQISRRGERTHTLQQTGGCASHTGGSNVCVGSAADSCSAEQKLELESLFSWTFLPNADHTSL